MTKSQCNKLRNWWEKKRINKKNVVLFSLLTQINEKGREYVFGKK